MEFLRRLLEKNIAEGPTTPPPPKGRNIIAAVRAVSGYSRLIILLGIILITGLWMFVWHQVNNDYDRSIAEASQETMNLAIAYEENVRRIVAEADKDLLSMKNAYEKGGISSPVIAESMQNWTNDSARNQVAICNEQGILILSFYIPALGTNISEREYFQFQRSPDADSLFIGKPIQNKINRLNTIPLSRRLNKPDGSFGGIVYIGLQADYFLEFYDKIDLGENQEISLTGLDGIVRARQSGNNLEAGQDLTSSALWKNIQINPYGTYIANTASDGIPRVLSYRVMSDYPLAFTIGKTTKVALAGYEQRKQNYFLGASLFSLFILALCGLLIDRAAKQRTLNARLEVMVNERTQQVQAQNEELQAKEEELTEVNRKLVESGAVVQAERERLSSLINSISDQVWFADTKKQITKADTPHKRTPGTVAPVFSVLLKRMPKYG